MFFAVLYCKDSSGQKNEYVADVGDRYTYIGIWEANEGHSTKSKDIKTQKAKVPH